LQKKNSRQIRGFFDMLAEGSVLQPKEATLQAPAGVTFIAAEKVLLLAVPMAGMTAAQRRSAVAFAVEGMIARPLEDVQVTLGPAVAAAETWLVAVVAKDVLAQTPPRAKTRLLPDVLALPVPATGQWSVHEEASRVLVRTANGAGFATDVMALPYYHLAAGRPDIVLFAGTLDAPFPILSRAALPKGLDPALRTFNLAQTTATSFGNWRKWRPLAAVATFAAVVHIGVLAADVWALNRINTHQQDTLRTTLSEMGQPADGDLDATITALISQTSGANAPQFTTLTAGVFSAIAAEQGRVTASELRYAGDANSLTLQLQAPDIATLQSVESLLNAAGFTVAAGAATTRDGLAEQEMTLAGGGA
jgi:general secretion pathway protein L